MFTLLVAQKKGRGLNTAAGNETMRADGETRPVNGAVERKTTSIKMKIKAQGSFNSVYFVETKIINYLEKTTKTNHNKKTGKKDEKNSREENKGINHPYSLSFLHSRFDILLIHAYIRKKLRDWTNLHFFL